ncbi:MAG: hypothetical protein ACEPO8_07570 [Rhodothermaceae bacterium]
MSEDKLKDLWEELNQPQDNKAVFSEEQMRDMLEGKANDIFTRITKNLKIGMGLLGLYMVMMFFGLYNIYFSGGLISRLNLSWWYLAIDLFSDIFVIASFIYFVVSFNKLNINAISGNQLKDTIKSAIKILKTYRKFFYAIVAIISTSGFAGFLIGASYGLDEARKLYGDQIAANPNGELMFIIFLIIFGFIFLCIITLVWYVFKKLYGDYIEKLEDCYDELTETE